MRQPIAALFSLTHCGVIPASKQGKVASPSEFVLMNAMRRYAVSEIDAHASTLFRRKHLLLRFVAAFLVFTSAIAPLFAQTPLDTFNPNVTGGLVRAMVVQPDGKIVIGGNFTT